MMYLHRVFGILVAVVLLFVAVTGTLVALADLKPLVANAPMSDPDMQSMNAHSNGPPNYAVVAVQDYTAAALPDDYDFEAGIARLSSLARGIAPDEPLRLIELRMAAGRPIGLVQLGNRKLALDPQTGLQLLLNELPSFEPVKILPSLREVFKGIHRFRFLASMAVWLNVVAALVFALLVYTGMLHYFRLLASRRKLGRSQPLWRAGGWWRDLHRWTSVVAGIFVIVLTLSGLGLAINSWGLELHNMNRRPVPGSISPRGDASSPLRQVELGPMTSTTLASFRAAAPKTGVRVLRLRNFANYPQGVVVTSEKTPRQLVFHAVTGRKLLLTEPGYPENGFPFGWQVHQWLKQIHRGDMFGMPGRWFEALGGLSMIYLSVSGIVMYFQMWVRRRRSGRPAFIWR